MLNSLSKAIHKDTYIKYSKNNNPTIQEILIPGMSNISFENINNKLDILEEKYFHYIENEYYILYDDKIILLESWCDDKIKKYNQQNKIYKIEENIIFIKELDLEIKNNKNIKSYKFIIQEKNKFKKQLNYIPYCKQINQLNVERRIYKLTHNSDIFFIFEKHTISSNSKSNNFYKFYIETHNNKNIDDIMTQEIIISFIQTIN